MLPISCEEEKKISKQLRSKKKNKNKNHVRGKNYLIFFLKKIASQYFVKVYTDKSIKKCVFLELSSVQLTQKFFLNFYFDVILKFCNCYNTF